MAEVISEAIPGLPTAFPRGRRAALALLLLVAGAYPALACQTRDVAQAAAVFDPCDTPWEWVHSDAEEDLFSCEDPRCDDGTVLRITLREMHPDDAAMSKANLLEDWTKRIIPSKAGDYSVEMAGDISVMTIGTYEGIYIPLLLTHTDGDSYTSLAFRIPRDGDYVVANATGDIDRTVLHGLLDVAVENFNIKGLTR